MKFLLLILVVLLNGNAWSITFKDIKIKLNQSGGKINRTLAGTKAETGIKTLVEILACVRNGVNADDIKRCSAQYFSKKLTPYQRNILLAWFSMPFSLTEPKECDSLELEMIPNELLTGNSVFLCSENLDKKIDQKIIFFMMEEGGQLTLSNIKK